MKWLIIPFVIVIGFIPLAHADLWCDIFGCEIQPIEERKLYFSETKQIDLSRVEDGSDITNVKVSVSNNYPGLCKIYIDDPILNEKAASELFQCSSSSVTINRLGMDAMKYKSGMDDKIKFTVKAGNTVIDSTLEIVEYTVNAPTKFAKIEDGKVTNIIISDSVFVNSLDGNWVETSDTMRVNKAGIGYTFDNVNDVFIPPKKHDSWMLDKTKWQYVSPIPYPEDGLNYTWEEKSNQWVRVH